MKKHMIGFHRWMLKHDTADNAEAYFHYTDEDMVEEYFKDLESLEKVSPCVGHDTASWEEEANLNERMDIIGQNGNEGTHYDK